MSDEIKRGMEEENSTEPELQESDVSQIIGGGLPKYGDIKGDTTSSGYKEWIELS